MCKSSLKFIAHLVN